MVIEHQQQHQSQYSPLGYENIMIIAYKTTK